MTDEAIADGAFATIRVLMWRNPSGLIADEYIPRWLTDKAIEQIAKVPIAELRAAGERAGMEHLMDLWEGWLKTHQTSI